MNRGNLKCYIENEQNIATFETMLGIMVISKLL